VSDFISEDDLSTFEGWLRYQGIDAATTTPDELADWRDMFCAPSCSSGHGRLRPAINDPGLIAYECPSCGYVTSVLTPGLVAGPAADEKP
jgi:hypothetical protein